MRCPNSFAGVACRGEISGSVYAGMEYDSPVLEMGYTCQKCKRTIEGKALPRVDELEMILNAHVASLPEGPEVVMPVCTPAGHVWVDHHGLVITSPSWGACMCGKKRVVVRQVTTIGDVR